MVPFGRTVKRLGGVVCLCWALFALPLSGWSSPPSNDTCAGAEEIPAAGPFPWISPLIPDLSLATSAGDLPVSCVSEASNAVWYAFTPTEAGFYIFSTGADTETTVDDTVLGVYTGDGAGCGGVFTEIDCNDDEGDLRAGIAIDLEQDVTYYILASVGFFGFNEGRTALQVRVTKPEAPENDDCKGALEVPSAGPFPYTTAPVDTVLATVALDPLPSCINQAYRGVWYTFTPAESAYYKLTTCSTETETTLFDDLMAVYTAAGGCDGPFVEVACSDDGCGNSAEVRAFLAAGTPYFILVWDVWFRDPIIGETRVQLAVAPVDPPTATTLAATSISSNGALLRGEIDPNGLPATAVFEWGPTAAYGGSLTLPNTLTGDAPVIVTAFVSGFSPGALVHYRVSVTNLLGKIDGSDRTFQWVGTPPVITDFRQLSSGAYRLEFDAVEAQAYFLQAADSSLGWSIVGQAVDEGGGKFSFENNPGPAVRYFRVFAP